MSTTFDYASVRDKDVDPLIEEFGTLATLIVKETQFYNVDSGDVTPRITEYIVKVVLDNQQKTYQDGKLITDDRKRAYLSPKDLAVVPKINDDIIIDEETFKITQVLAISPASVTVLYELILEN